MVLLLWFVPGLFVAGVVFGAILEADNARRAEMRIGWTWMILISCAALRRPGGVAALRAESREGLLRGEKHPREEEMVPGGLTR